VLLLCLTSICAATLSDLYPSTCTAWGGPTRIINSSQHSYLGHWGTQSPQPWKGVKKKQPKKRKVNVDLIFNKRTTCPHAGNWRQEFRGIKHDGNIKISSSKEYSIYKEAEDMYVYPTPHTMLNFQLPFYWMLHFLPSTITNKS